MNAELAAIDRAVRFLRPKVGALDAAVILGSGMSRALPLRGDAIPFAKIPGFPASSVLGHAGVLQHGKMKGTRVAVLRGRAHLYEGHGAAEIARPVRVMARLGIRTLIVTNAAGVVESKFRPGDLMFITDHINLSGGNPLRGPNLDTLGPRFPDMSSAYDPDLTRLGLRLAGRSARRGVYAAMPGPSFETPAEIRMLRGLGAHAVGMSTVHEVIAAVHAGVKVVGISCLTNWAAGLARQPLNHEEVLEVTARVEDRLGRVLEGLLQ